MKDMDKMVVEASTQFETLLGYLAEAAAQPTALHEVEREVFRALLALGRTLLRQFLQHKGVGDYGPTLSVDTGEPLPRGALTSRPYLSIFGEVAIERYVYGAAAAGQAPLDGELNLPEWKYSYLLQEWGLHFTTKESFHEAGHTLAQILGLDPGVRTLERLSEKVAPGVEEFRAALPPPPPAEEAALLVATVDCKGVPLLRPPGTKSKKGKRRAKGEKKNKKKMACVGAVYTIDPFVRTVDDILDEVQRQECALKRPRPVHKRVQAELLAGKEPLFASLAQQVAQRHGEPAQKVLFLSDGERRLWTLQQKFLPDAIGILDLWHVMEYLWKGAQVFYPEQSPQAEAWVTHRLQMLLEGKVGRVIGGLKQMQAKQALKGTAKKTLTRVITYFHNNRAHMGYDEYIAQGYPIGSGVAEGACRHLVKDRMERTGMRWAEAGAQAMLDLRSTYLNGDWKEYWIHYTKAEEKRLYGHLNLYNTTTYKATG